MKTIIEMAREAGFTPSQDQKAYIEMLEHFAELVRADERELVLAAAIDGAEHAARKAIADEREACAKVCEDLETSGNAEFYGHVFAYAIRSRGNT